MTKTKKFNNDEYRYLSSKKAIRELEEYLAEYYDEDEVYARNVDDDLYVRNFANSFLDYEMRLNEQF